MLSSVILTSGKLIYGPRFTELPASQLRQISGEPSTSQGFCFEVQWSTSLVIVLVLLIGGSYDHPSWIVWWSHENSRLRGWSTEVACSPDQTLGSKKSIYGAGWELAPVTPRFLGFVAVHRPGEWPLRHSWHWGGFARAFGGVQLHITPCIQHMIGNAESGADRVRDCPWNGATNGGERDLPRLDPNVRAIWWSEVCHVITKFRGSFIWFNLIGNAFPLYNL